ncbi:uncharacterized protein LOC114288414 [Camellia sinensis]|uniref:uncharacterized protein LOC114288414 n=1 Tax=Camellia sinensis TaxID=4442 RepID=UPI0010368D99|nr:uncharacterized protein LOC114288414 [Camellia sinensis]
MGFLNIRMEITIATVPLAFPSTWRVRSDLRKLERHCWKICVAERSSSHNAMVEIEKNHGGNGEDKTMVQISLKTIGPSPSLLNVPSLIKVQDLRRLIAGKAHLPIENLRLILQGNVLHDNKNGLDEFVQLNNEDSLIVAVKPKPPVKHIQDGLDEDDDEGMCRKF